MRILLYECRKILSIRLLLIVLLFSFLFYHLFLSYRYYPDASADMVAEKQLCDNLIAQTGYSLSLDQWDLIDAQKEKSILKLNQLVQDSKILQSYHIDTYQQLRDKLDQMLDGSSNETYIKEIDEEAANIVFGAGMEDVFLLQQINDWEIEKNFYRQDANQLKEDFNHFFEYEDVTDASYKRYIELFSKDSISLLPSSIFDVTSEDFPMIGILMLISCTIVILPYFIKEKNQDIYQVSIASKTGRCIYSIQWKAALLVCILLCILQIMVYLGALSSVGILSYLSAPTNTIRRTALWYDISFGTYLLLYSALLLFLVVGCMNIIILLSRISNHYMIGCALALPILYGIGRIFLYSISSFLMYYGTSASEISYKRPILLLIGSSLIAIIIIVRFAHKDKRMDVVW